MMEPEPDRFHVNSNTIHVGGKPKRISFSGCGFLGVYHIGVGSCLKQHAPGLVDNLDRIYGCSAGSIVGAMLLTNVCFGEVCQRTMDIVMDARSRYLGPLSPGFRLNETLIRDMRGGLPEDAHIRASGKLFVSLTRLRDGENVIVSDYKTREELIQVLICSCFVPFYSGLFPPKYRGVYYVDGGLSNNLPADHETITVSPWSGNSDICPSNDGLSLVDINFVNTSIQITPSNMYRISRMFFPPNPKVLKDFCDQGFSEAVQFLRDNGLFETDLPLKKNLSFASKLHKIEERRMMTRRLSYTARCMTCDDVRETDNDDTASSSSQSSYSDAVPKDCRLEECFEDDEEDRNCGIVLPVSDHNDVETQSVFTVVHVYPIDHDHVIRVQLQLPPPVLEVLESVLARSNPVVKKPLYRLLSTLRHSFVVRIPLEKTYSTACLILSRSKSFPNDITWLVGHLRQLVRRLQFVMKCSGDSLVEKLKLANGKAEKELVFLSQQLTVTVQLLTKRLFYRATPYYPNWLIPVVNRLPCSQSTSNRAILQVV